MKKRFKLNLPHLGVFSTSYFNGLSLFVCIWCFWDKVSPCGPRWLGTQFVTQSGLGLTTIPLTQHPDGWDYRQEPPCLLHGLPLEPGPVFIQTGIFLNTSHFLYLETDSQTLTRTCPTGGRFTPWAPCLIWVSIEMKYSTDHWLNSEVVSFCI